MAPRVVDKEKKRERILRAALKVFAKHGIRDFKVIQIAEEAGVGKGTLYEYFPSKDSLISGSVSLFFRDYADYVGQRTAEVSKPIEQLKALIAATFEYFADQRERLEVMYHIWGAGMADPRRGDFLAEMTETYRQIRSRLSRIIQNGIRQDLFREIEPELAASMVLALVDGLLYQAVSGLTDIEDQRLPERIVRIILEGIRK